MGKLNISHHKSWHPYSHKAQEIVRKDEEAAAIITKAKEEKILAQEREFRLNSLKSRAGVKSSPTSSSLSETKPANINLFESLIKDEEKEANIKHGKNAEFMKDEAEREAKWDKQYQITNYLVDNDAKNPWYTQKGAGDYYTGEKTKYGSIITNDI
jgi:hypothetical protein